MFPPFQSSTPWALMTSTHPGEHERMPDSDELDVNSPTSSPTNQDAKALKVTKSIVICDYGQNMFYMVFLHAGLV